MLTLKRLTFSLVVVGMFFITLPIFWPHPVAAQNDSDQCQGLDLVVLVDQSISMQQNDPEQIRVYAIRLLIDSLGNNVLYECPDVVHRLSVIAFGAAYGGSSATVPVIESVKIAPQLDTFKVWEGERSSIRAEIPESIEYISGGTDFRAAFEAAQRRFAQWQADTSVGSPRRQTVVLIADGGPCINFQNACFDLGGSQGQYMADLEAYLSPTGADFPWRGNTNPQSIGVWFIAMNDVRQTGYNYLADPNLRATWERITSSHDGAFLSLDSSRDPNSINYDISVAVADIADDITGSGLIQTTCSEPFYIEPYLDNAMIRILKIGSNPGVAFEDVKVSIVYKGPQQQARLLDGRVVEGAVNVIDYISDGPNEHYILASPPPGVYEVEVSGADQCRDLNVAYKVYPLTGTIVAPVAGETLAQFDEPPYYDPNEPDYMRFAIFGGNKQQVPIFSDPEFPLSLTAVIERPDGSTQTLTFDEQPDGTWRSSEALEVAMAGEYRWNLTGTSPSANPGIDQTEQFTPTGRFAVRPVQRFDIQILEPQPDDSLNLVRISQSQVSYEPFEVLIQPQLVGSRDRIGLNEFQPDAAKSPFEVSVSNALQKSSAIPVIYDPTRSAWIAKVTPGENGVPVLVGPQTLQVALNPEGYNRTDYRPSVSSGGGASIRINRTIQLNGGVLRSPAGTVAQYDEEPFYDPDYPIRFRYQVTGYADGSGLAASLPPERLKIVMSVSDSGMKTQTQELTSLGNGLWESPAPLTFAEAGSYEWEVTVSARNAADTNLIKGFTDSGRFTVNRVGRYRIEVLSPLDGEIYPLNQVTGGRVEETPLAVEVALVDTETGEYLTDQDLNNGVDPSQVFSVTVQGTLQSTGPIGLDYDTVNRTWRQSLGLSAGEAPDEESFQTLAVSFDEQSVDRGKYRPSIDLRDQDRAQFERVRIQPLALEPKLTEIRSATHGGPTFCYNAQVIPLEVQIAIIKASGFEEVLDADSVIRDQVESIAKVALIEPTTRLVLEEGRLELVSIDGNLGLKAIVGETYVKPGVYELQIIPQNDALLARYQFLSQAPITVTVTRTSSFLYAPSTCQGIQYMGIGLAVLLMSYMVYCGFQRPSGLLELLDDKGRSVLNEYQLGKDLALLFRTSQWIKAVPDPDIGKIEVKRGDPQDAAFSAYDDISLEGDGKKERKIRAVRITVYDQSGEVITEHTLVSGMDMVPISMNTQVRYT